MTKCQAPQRRIISAVNETGRFLNSFARSRSDIVEAKVVSLNEDGSYTCRLFSSQAIVRATPSNTNERYTPNSLVLLAAPSASRTVVGTTHTILSRAPKQQRGISASQPDAVVTRKPMTPTVMSVEPNPLEIEQGSSGQQIIRGFGFSDPATYEDGVDVDDSEVTEIEVTMDVSAPIGTPLGLYDAELHGIAIKDAVRVVEAGEAEHTAAVFIPGSRVFKVSVDDGSLLRVSVELPQEVVRTFTIAPDTVIAFYEAGGAAILNRRLDLLASITGVNGGLLRFPPVNERTQIAYDGTDSLWYGSGNVLCKVDVTTGNAVTIHTAGAIYEGVASDGANTYACSRANKQVRKYDRATGALVTSVDLATLNDSVGIITQPRAISVSGGGLLVLCHDVIDTSRFDIVPLDAALAPQLSPNEGVYGGDRTFFPIGSTVVYAGYHIFALRLSDLGTIPYDMAADGSSRQWLAQYPSGTGGWTMGSEDEGSEDEPTGTGWFLCAIGGPYGDSYLGIGHKQDGSAWRVWRWVHDGELNLMVGEFHDVDGAVPVTQAPCGFLESD